MTVMTVCLHCVFECYWDISWINVCGRATSTSAVVHCMRRACGCGSVSIERIEVHPGNCFTRLSDGHMGSRPQTDFASDRAKHRSSG